MSVSRRKALRFLGGSCAALAAAGVAGGGAFVFTRTPTRALLPWEAAAAAEGEPRLRALAYAVLAPNPHNRQPWLFDLEGEEGLAVYCELERRLPETDPEDRQITIGFGCLLELLDLAAAEDGYALEISPFPEGAPEPRLDRRPIARVRWRRDQARAKDPLFRQVLARRSNKEPFDRTRPVPVAVLERLRQAARFSGRVGVSAEAARVEALRDLTWRAHEVEVRTPRTLMESVRLMRIGKAEIEANPDGIDIGGAFPEALKLAGVLTRETIADPGSEAFAQGLALYDEIIHSAMAHLWITTPGNGRRAQLETGRDWLRINLAATAEGLGLHPLSQALQEYPEMTALFAEVHGLLDAGGGRVQMLARLGYGPEVPPSPRWPVGAKMLER